MYCRAALMAALLTMAMTAAPSMAATAHDGSPLPAFTEWESFTTRDGLPADEVMAIRIDGGRVWAGTKSGLALYEGGRWRTFGVADGLPHRVVLSIDVSPRTGDVWVGTMGGLARLSGGRIDVFKQVSSGLPNDFVHGVKCDPDEDVVWAATAMGAGRLDLRTGTWSIFNQTNTPMHEPWTYAVGTGAGLVYVGAWGGGILEYTKGTDTWRAFRDPDKEFELDLLPDDGPVSDVTSGIDYADGILWQSSYTGLARYEGRRWRTFFAEDSGLVGNFVNFVRAKGRTAWIASDQGLGLTDGERWLSYRRLDDGRGEIVSYEGPSRTGRLITRTAIAYNYVLSMDADASGVWVATGKGVSHGFRPVDRLPAWGDKAKGSVNATPAKPLTAHYADTPDQLVPFKGRVFKNLFTEKTQLRAPGREDPDPSGLTEVRLGFIGPLTNEDHPVLSPAARSAVSAGPKAAYGRRMLHAATLAVEEANAAGGYKGLPFKIVPRTDLVVWGQTSNELAGFVFEDGVWAVLASIDSNHNHVLSRAALKAEVAIVSAGSTDPTLVEHSIPWVARCIADDRQLSYALLHEVFVVRRLERVAMLRVNDRDGRTGVGEFVDGSRRLGHPIVIEQRFEPGQTEFKEAIERIREAGADAIVLWGNPEETGAAVKQIRAAGMTVPLFGFDRMTQPAFLKSAGPAAEGVVVVATMNPDRPDAAWQKFRRAYRERWSEEPDTYAAHAYDGMNIILRSVHEGGLNRLKIRDRIFDIDRYPGVSGEIVFDTNMSNVARVWLAAVEQGRFRYRTAPEWEKR